MVCKDTTLQYFNICKPVTVQHNASQKACILPSFKMAAQLPLLPRLLYPWSSTMPTQNMYCLPSSLEHNDSTPMSLVMPSLLRVTISLSNRSTSRIWQIHQFVYRECCSDSKPMMSPSSTDLAKRCWLQMSSLAMLPSRLQRYL